MGVFIEIKSDAFTGRMEMNNVEDVAKQQVIKGFFEAVVQNTEFLGEALPVDSIMQEGKECPKEPQKITKVAEKVTKPMQQVTGSTQESIDRTERNRRLPLVGAANRTTTSIYELVHKEQESFQEESGQPDFYKTGIKIDDDGRERYKCRYWCGCGNKGNHYIPLGTEVVTCHDCKQEHEVINATGEFDEDGVPTRDNYGNFFIARFN